MAKPRDIARNTEEEYGQDSNCRDQHQRLSLCQVGIKLVHENLNARQR